MAMPGVATELILETGADTQVLYSSCMSLKSHNTDRERVAERAATPYFILLKFVKSTRTVSQSELIKRCL